MSERQTSKAKRTQRGTARDRVLAAAAARFYTHGVGATGIDVITAEAGVAKMSLYNNFASKAALVEAYLEQRQQEFRELHRERMQALSTDAGPIERSLTVFDAYLDHAESTGRFRGCGLLNAAAELAFDDPGREAVVRHKTEVERMLYDALEPHADESALAGELAEHLSLILEGAMVRAGLDADTLRLRRARALAFHVIASRWRP